MYQGGNYNGIQGTLTFSDDGTAQETLSSGAHAGATVSATYGLQGDNAMSLCMQATCTNFVFKVNTDGSIQMNDTLGDTFQLHKQSG
jgi:hypothetical protein